MDSAEAKSETKQALFDEMGYASISPEKNPWHLSIYLYFSHFLKIKSTLFLRLNTTKYRAKCPKSSQMLNPLVSIIIPAYNRENTVAETIRSVQDQTYKNLELIVVDDGSTDKTYEVLKDFGDTIKIIRQANAGVSAARNTGIKEAKGEIITFLDSDDLWLPQKIEKQVTILNALGPEIPCCWCNSLMSRSDGSKVDTLKIQRLNPNEDQGIWINPLEFFAARFVLMNQAIAVRRSAMKKLVGFEENLWVLEDLEFALRLAMLGPWAFIREPLVVWRSEAENSLSAAAYEYPLKMFRCKEKIYETILNQEHNFTKRTEKLLRYQLKRTKLKALSYTLIQRTGTIFKISGYLLLFFIKISDWFFKRSPYLPKMDTVPL